MHNTRDKSPLVTIVIVTWNAAADIEECLSSIMKQNYTNFDVIVVDSASTDRTAEIVRTKFPQVRIVTSKENLGYRGGNRLGMELATGEYVVVCNDDVVVEPNWLVAMLNQMENDPTIGMATPMILIYGQPGIMNMAGNTLHFTTIYGPRAKNSPASSFSKSEDIAAVSGCCFMIRRHLLTRIGGFSKHLDQTPQLWHASIEDVDLCWHVQTLGYRIRYVADAVMHHKYQQPPAENVNRFVTLQYGRLLFLARNIDTSALICLSPAIVLVEMATFVYALSKGSQWSRAILQMWKWLILHRQMLLHMRRSLKPLRKRSYWHIIPNLSPTIDLAAATSGWPKGAGNFLLNAIFWLYFHFLILISHLFTLGKNHNAPQTSTFTNNR